MQPWTSRPEIMLHGVTPQPVDKPTFIKEIVDTRFLAYCARNSLQPSIAREDVSDRLFTDLRHDIHHQIASGSMVMQTSSLPYWYRGDRVAMPIEFFSHNGYDIEELNVQDVNIMIPDWPADAAAGLEDDDPPGPSRKKQKTRVCKTGRNGLVSTKLVDLAANGMCLPDLMMIIYTSLLSAETDLWEHEPFYDHRSDIKSNTKSNSSVASDDHADSENLNVESLSAHVMRMLQSEEDSDGDGEVQSDAESCAS